ncbi:MAG: hypothetical protein IJW08_05320 [Lentisphaeria bacterium]|nr:hypothetical protein [Lentisphaeria bacterium]
MRVNFEKTTIPCVTAEEVMWHIAHGYVWNIREVSGRYVGVFFATLLCGDGVIIHFLPVAGISIHFSTVLSAFRKAKKLFPIFGSVVFATVPEKKRTLIRLLAAMNFSVTGAAFVRENEGRIILLQYLNTQ